MTSDYLTAPVAIDPDKPLRASADAMRAYTKATGTTLTDVLQGEDDADRFQALAFFELYDRAANAGHLPDSGELYELAGRVPIVFETPSRVIEDPLGAASSRTSPPSVATGG